MTTKSSRAFFLWRRRMGFSYTEAAKVLGLCASAVGFYSRGVRKDKSEDDERVVEVPTSILLACAAVEKNIPPIE